MRKSPHSSVTKIGEHRAEESNSVLADSLDCVEVDYMDRAVEAWVWWSYGVGPQQPVSFAKLMRITKTESMGHLLDLTDDQLLKIDRTIAQMPGRAKELIEVEYRQGGTSEQKGQRFGLNRNSYRIRVKTMLSFLYGELMPDIEDWRNSVL